MAQAVFYSLITIVVVEAMLSVWHIDEPASQLKFRSLALLIPVLCPPLYYLLYPQRNAIPFRQETALIDINKWLNLRLFGEVNLWHLFAAMLVITAGAFLVKEAVPIARHYLGPRSWLPAIKKGQFPALDEALAALPPDRAGPAPVMLLSPEDTPVAYSWGHHAIVISAPMINMLGSDELQAVIAHEIVHLSQAVFWTNRALLVLRLLLFYNPLALLVFRSMANDVEKLCDDMAIRLSGKRLPLTSGLFKMLQHSMSIAPAEGEGRRLSWPRFASLENAACQSIVKERVKRLVHRRQAASVPYPNFRVTATCIMLAAVLFFVV